DSIEHFLNLKIDSLNSSKLPTHRYQEKCDSIKQKKQQLAQRFNSKLDSLKRNTTAKLDSIPMPPELKGYVGEYTSKLENVGLDTDILPAIDIPGFSKLDISLPSLKDIGNGDALNLPTDLNLSGFDLPKADLNGIKNLNGQAGDLASQAKALSETNLSEVQTMAAKEAEQQVAKISGAAELTKQAEGFDKVMPPASEEEAKAQLIEQGKDVAIDHFAEKGDALKGAMDKVSKYKQQYSSISSLEDLKKRPPNPLRGKPFIERLIPGVSFQYQRRNDHLIDSYVYTGYKHTPRLVSGMGWNQRLARDKRNEYWNKRAAIYGPRAYAEYRIYRSFIIHAEGEVMNTFVPYSLMAANEGSRQWVWGMMLGLKTEYKITHWMKGTVLIQYNLFNRHHKAPYIDRLNSRFGFEFKLKK
ncbi:MAG: hypothetical protein EBU52_08895, partial [Cytophagia bacterium]|nr:hypothetical protein [Cytophagia bacterium]